jgi:hypothetical protein
MHCDVAGHKLPPFVILKEKLSQKTNHTQELFKYKKEGG